MGCTLHELAERMSAHEFAEHHALEQLEPYGTHAAGLHALLSALANGPLKPPNGRPLWQPGDFRADVWTQLLAPPPEPRQDTLADILAAARNAGMRTL